MFQKLFSKFPLNVNRGGTGRDFADLAIGDLIYGNVESDGVTPQLSLLTSVTAGSYLRSGGILTAPLWSTVKLPNTAAVGDIWHAATLDTVTGLAIGASGTLIRSNGTIPAYTSFTIPNTFATGDVLYGSATNVVSGLGGGSTGKIIRFSGTVPTWSTMTYPNQAAAGGIFIATFTDTMGLLAIDTAGKMLRSSGAAPTWTSFTMPASFALGDIIYGSATNVMTALAGNITTTQKFLAQTGTGAVSAAPAWVDAAGFFVPYTGATANVNLGVFKLGIGIAPTTPLHVSGAGDIVTLINPSSSGFLSVLIEGGTGNPVGHFYGFGSAYASSGRLIANSLLVESTQTAGLGLSCADVGPIIFYTSALRRATIFSGGGISIGDTTDPGSTNLRVVGTLTNVGRVYGGDGTALLPEFSFTSEATLGFWRSAAAQITLQGAFTSTGFSRTNTDFLFANPAGTLNWSARAVIASPANSQLNITNQLQTIGVGLDVATDATLKIRTRAQTGDAAVTASSYSSSAASPLLLTNGQLVTIALTAQTTGATTLTIPDFASVVDEFTFKTKAQTMSNKTFVAPALGAATATSLVASGQVSTALVNLPNTGGAATAGNNAMVLGTFTVNTTAATATCLVFAQRKTAGGTIGFASTYTINAGVSFTLTSDSALDTSTYSWWIVETH
jgi:hypothetical protein